MAKVLSFLGSTASNSNQLFDDTGSGSATGLQLNGYTQSGMPITDLTSYNNATYFSGGGTNGQGSQLWQVSSGTASQVSSNSLSSALDPSNLTVLGSQLYFSGVDNNGHVNLYATNGTTGGTAMVSVNNSGPMGLSPDQIVTFNNNLYFSGVDAAGNTGLWISNGTTGGTSELGIGNTDTNNLGGQGTGLNPANITVANGKLFFAATDSTGQDNLWVSSGTVAGTTEIKAGNQAGAGLMPTSSNMVAFNGLTYFAGHDSAGKTGLWATDGTSGGTHEIAVNGSAGFGVNPVSLTVFNGALYFGGSDANGGVGLWKSDGTTGGTSELSVSQTGSSGLNPIAVNASDYPNVSMTVFNNQLYFSGVGSNGLYDLWTSDGTAAGTVQVQAQGGSTTGLGLLPTDFAVVDYATAASPITGGGVTGSPVGALPAAPGAVTIGSGHDAITLLVSEDAYAGDAQYTISVDGKQIGGTLTETANHAAGQNQQITIGGDFGDGTHAVAINFLNDATGSNPGQDRNLYASGASYNGVAAGGSLSLMSAGAQTITVGTPAPGSVTVGSGADTVALNISEDRYLGDAQFTVSVDGNQVGGTQTALASHSAGQSQVFDIEGNFGAGNHTVAVNFVNDASGGTALLDRNLYVTATSYDGAVATNGSLTEMAGGSQSVTVSSAIAQTINLGSGSDTVSLKVSEEAYQGDAQYTVSVDGQQIGGILTSQANHAAGQDQTINLAGNFGAGQHQVTLNFLNDATGSTPDQDRNLYLDGASYDGSAAAKGTLNLMSAGPQTVTVGTPPAYAPLLQVGNGTPQGTDIVSLKISEDAYAGDAQFSVLVDGKQIGGVITAQASHAAGQDQTLNVVGNFGQGQHTVTLNLLNDLTGPNIATQDRNLYVDGASYDGVVAPNTSIGILSATPESITVGTPVPSTLNVGMGSDTIALKISEDAYQGDAQYTVMVDGQQIGGTMSASASHAAGQDQTLNVAGNFAAGNHTVTLNFLNDLYGGTATTDRNLYLDGASIDGAASNNATLSLMSSGPGSVTVSAAVPSTVVVGSGADTVGLKVSEDAYQGNAQFNVLVDGKQVGGTQTAQASRLAGATQLFNVEGNFGAGPHTVSVNFLNDAYGGSITTDRNLYVNGATYDGATVANGQLSLLASGTQSFQAATPDTLVLNVSEDAYQGDAQYVVTVDGKQVGGTMTATASHAAGQSQSVTLTGSFGLGSHTVGVNFLNDAYGGTAATDRNLYVNSATYDAHTTVANQTFLNNGTQTTGVVSSTTYNTGAAGGSITTLGADTVNATSGLPTSNVIDSMASINAQGPSVSVTGGSGQLSFVGNTGNDTVHAGIGSATLVGNADTLNFVAGAGAASVTAGTGHELYTLVNGQAGGSLVISGFTSGLDSIHLQGYSGTGIASQQVVPGATLFTLTDSTKITLAGTTNLSNAHIFS